MCGIAGLMTRDGRAPDPRLLDRLEAALAHRGPDGTGRLVRADTGLVHLRLAIVDLQTGDQPLFASQGAALIANGEIYNDPDLRREMRDTPFRTRSDCEPAVHLYETDGVAFADRLRGMYAIALHDSNRNRLVLARDPFGIKPLYYVQTDQLFAFASEPQALLAAGLVPRAVDPVARSELLQLKFTCGRPTIFPGIDRVLPGETLVVERGKIVSRHHRAALPLGRPTPTNQAAAISDLERVLLDSVTAHLRADVPYGLFLSGGIDSATLLALMRRATGQRIHVLTAGWDVPGAVDESREAERLAGLLGADCHRVTMGEQDFWRLAPRIAAAIDDPTADAAVLPSYLLGRAAAADGLKVTLCGEGADELFGGYSRYRKRLAPLRWITRPPRGSGLFDPVPGLERWRERLSLAERAVTVNRTPLQAAQALDCVDWLPNDLLTKLDRTLMVHGVEGRTPFLDPVVAGFAFLLPDREKVGPRYGKHLLRSLLAAIFPQAGAWERKKGFKPPIGAWIAARGPSLGRMVAEQPGVAALFPRDLVLTSVANAARSPQPAWSLLFYALWHSRHVLGMLTDGDIGDVLRPQMKRAA